MKKYIRYELDRLIYMPGRTIYGVYVQLNPRVLFEVGIIREISDIIASRGIPIIHLLLSVPNMALSMEPINLTVFIDLTGRENLINDLLNEFRVLDYVEKVRTIKPIRNGLAVEDVFFPVTVLGERAIILRKPGIDAFINGLRRELGEAYESILYHIGFELGSEFYKSHIKLAGGDKDLVVKIACELFRIAGFGIIEVTKINYDEMYGELIVRDNFECKSVGSSSSPSGFFVGGILAGWISEYFGREIRVKEVECIAKGDEYCRYVFEKI